LRQAALREGKIIYMAVPRLRRERCFIELDPKQLGGAFVNRKGTHCDD
jgi:5-formyltetrahydrofolate cyclo-ligase